MDTQNLKAFLQVAATGSFSLAAEKLHLTQPAVSKRVAQLEAQLDAQLFDRIGRHVSLTEAGAALLPHARAVQRDLLAAEQSVRDLAGEVGGRLKLATSHHIGLHRLPPVLSHFSTHYTGVHIDIDFMDSEQAYDLTLRGEIELAVVTLAPEAVPHIVAQEIWPDPLDFMVQLGHPLTQHAGLDISALSAVPAVLPGLNTYTGQIVKRNFEQRGVPLTVSMTTNYLETIHRYAPAAITGGDLSRGAQLVARGACIHANPRPRAGGKRQPGGLNSPRVACLSLDACDGFTCACLFPRGPEYRRYH